MKNINTPSKRELTLDKLRISMQKMILKSQWDEIGVQDIAADANLSIGTFYNYFESKNAALEDLKRELSQIICRDLMTLLNIEKNPVHQLTLFIKYFFELIQSKTVWVSYLLGGKEFSDRLEPNVEYLLLPILEAGSESELFSIEVNNVVVNFIEKGLYGLLQQALDNKEEVEYISSHFAELTLKMVGVPPKIAKETSNITCPCTPLYSLPISMLMFNKTYREYEKDYS